MKMKIGITIEEKAGGKMWTQLYTWSEDSSIDTVRTSNIVTAMINHLSEKDDDDSQVIIKDKPKTIPVYTINIEVLEAHGKRAVYRLDKHHTKKCHPIVIREGNDIYTELLHTISGRKES